MTFLRWSRRSHAGPERSGLAEMAVRTTASAQQLAEFLAAVSSSPDAATAVRSALERAAEAVEADVAAAVTGGEVTVGVGLPDRELPTGALVGIAGGEARPLDIPGARTVRGDRALRRGHATVQARALPRR